MRSKNQKTINFKKIVYFCLTIFVLECVVYFAKTLYSPPPIFAQSKIEGSESATLLAEPSSQPSPILQTAPQSITFKLPILIYHYVEYITDQRDTIRKSLNIQPNTFEAQINTLKEAGFTFITPSQIGQMESGNLKIEKPIIISFDDGYGDFYTDVFPILYKNNVKAAAYIVPGFLGHKNYMTWDQVKEIAQNNLIEIGAHSMHHPSLDSLSDQAATEEINQSKLALELSLGHSITTFAYPYGHFTNKAVELVKSAGFTSALTTTPGTNENVSEKFILKRIHPGSTIKDNLLNKIGN